MCIFDYSKRFSPKIKDCHAHTAFNSDKCFFARWRETLLISLDYSLSAIYRFLRKLSLSGIQNVVVVANFMDYNIFCCTVLKLSRGNSFSYSNIFLQ